MDEDALVRQLQELERSTADGGAIGNDACRAELAEWRRRQPDHEFQMSVGTPEAQRVVLGWCQRYGVTPYRKPKQRQSTVCVRVPRGFMQERMWPRVQAMMDVIESATVDAVTRIVERWTGMSLDELDASDREDDCESER